MDLKGYNDNQGCRFGNQSPSQYFRDDYNDWIQLGDSDGRICWQHIPTHSGTAPNWGLIAGELDYVKGNILCCSKQYRIFFFRDEYNDWIQLGDFLNRICWQHNPRSGGTAPSWGLNAGESDYVKGNILCCRKQINTAILEIIFSKQITLIITSNSGVSKI